MDKLSEDGSANLFEKLHDDNQAITKTVMERYAVSCDIRFISCNGECFSLLRRRPILCSARTVIIMLQGKYVVLCSGLFSEVLTPRVLMLYS